MKIKTVYIAKIEKEHGRYYVNYEVEKENGEKENMIKVFDSLKEAQISKSELKAFLNRWVILPDIPKINKEPKEKLSLKKEYLII